MTEMDQTPTSSTNERDQVLVETVDEVEEEADDLTDLLGDVDPPIDMGIILGQHQSPIIRDRRRDSYHSTVTLHTMHLHNEVNGATGSRYNLDPNRLSFPGSSRVPEVPNVSETPKPPVNPKIPQLRTITIDGRTMTMKQKPADKETFTSPRLWNKLVRSGLNADEKKAFVDSVVTYVLPKSNKLNVVSTKVDEKGMLKQVHSLEKQLKMLKAHVQNHDISDVFTIVIPNDLHQTGDLRQSADGSPEAYDLFDDFSRIHVSMVTASNAWYHYWINEPYVKENMSYSYMMLQKNTDENLWQKCLEDYEEYHPIQRGGPLMLYLILRRIQDTSEAAMEALKTQIKKLKITSIQGENVDDAVSLIKSTYKILTGASTSDRSYIPDDFNHTVLKVFQTTSVREFNLNFKEIERTTLQKADMSGMKPDWPSVSSIVNLAANSYSRMKADNKWHGTSRNIPTFHGDVTTCGSASTFLCFNCGKQGCSVNRCKEPLDQARISKNKKAFYDKRKASGSGTGRPNQPKYKKINGTPHVLNKKGTYVLDQRAVRREKEATELLAALASSDSSSNTSVPSSESVTSTSTTTSSTTPTTSVRQEQRLAAVARLRQMLSRR